MPLAPPSDPTEETELEELPDDNVELEEETEAEPEFDIFSDEAIEALPWLKTFDLRDKSQAVKVTREQLDALPLEAKQTVHNILKGFHERSRAHAELKRQATDGLRSLDQRTRELNQQRAKLAKVLDHPDLQALRKGPEGEAPDLWTEDGQKWQAEKYAAERFEQFFKAFEGAIGAQQQEIDKEQQAITLREQQEQHAAAREELRSFIAEHPDFSEHREAIVALRKARGNAITAQEAYWIVTAAQQRDGARDARHATVRAGPRKKTVTGPAGRPPPMPPGLSAREKMRYLQDHPDVQEQLLRKVRGGG